MGTKMKLTEARGGRELEFEDQQEPPDPPQATKSHHWLW